MTFGFCLLVTRALYMTHNRGRNVPGGSRHVLVQRTTYGYRSSAGVRSRNSSGHQTNTENREKSASQTRIDRLSTKYFSKTLLPWEGERDPMIEFEHYSRRHLFAFILTLRAVDESCLSHMENN